MTDSKLRAEWFWTDRWFASSACCLPIGARGLYRELLTRAWSLGANLPTNPAMLMRLAGVTREEWDEFWPQIEGYWREQDGRLVNDTQLEVYADCLMRQEAWSNRARKGAAARWGSSNGQATIKQCSSNAQAMRKECPQEPSLSLSQSQSKDQERAQTPGKATTSAAKKPAAPTAPAYSPDFDRFWKAYPRKVAKAAAWKAWQKNGRPDTDTIIAAVSEQAASEQWQRDGGQFIPHPATWLNQRRWEDEAPPAPTGPVLSAASRRALAAGEEFIRRHAND